MIFKAKTNGERLMIVAAVVAFCVWGHYDPGSAVMFMLYGIWIKMP